MNMRDTKLAVLNLIANEVKIDGDVFHPGMEDRIGTDNMNDKFIVIERISNKCKVIRDFLYILHVLSNELGGKGSENVVRKAVAIERTLPCTLEDLCKGTTKRMKISRDVLGASERPTTMNVILTIEIMPRWKKGTKIAFPEKENEQRGVILADLVFIIDEKPHNLFKRDDNDLIVTQKISLMEALTSYTV
ncbi:hypothetical protein FNV43_RR10269 [Rhamnella rubrinervis]|uniref:Chaperone DnaJ C-terminal domain-containing protein n=1 Tax=Rhamnella rubrinervis TaxID=2594499 RepID=A0A8K0ML60_9ROSA|nr:hypothetical protein FNV43_RR10269 [Rhamnella rubrinervis]